MYCENCGAALKEGAAFCPSCGAPVAPKPVETPTAPVYRQPAAPVYAPVVAPASRKPLIVPAILAIVAAVLFFVLWRVNLNRIPSFIASFLHDPEPFFGSLVFAMIFGDLLLIAASVFLFLFCIIQYRKGKTSLFGIGCLMLIISYGITLLSHLFRFGTYSVQINAWTSLYVFDVAIFVLLLIGTIGVFKKKLNKIVFIIASGLMLLEELINCAIAVTTGGQISPHLTVTNGKPIYDVLNLLAVSLLAVAILLIAILWKKPAEEN